jgi:acyl carrier protein
MGLDTVELVMDVEESFGVEIPDDAAQQIITVGDLFEFVKSQTDLAPAGTCLTAATFYDIRKGLQHAGITARFGPSTPLAEIVPHRERRSFWATLSQNTQLRLPDLYRPSWIVALNVLVAFSSSVLIALFASGRDASGTIFVVTGIACLIFIGWLTAIATKPFATEFATDFNTFRGLSERVLALNAATLKNKHGAMGPNDIWVILRELIVNQLGVDVDEVTPTANFVKDLGCD